LTGSTRFPACRNERGHYERVLRSVGVEVEVEVGVGVEVVSLLDTIDEDDEHSGYGDGDGDGYHGGKEARLYCPDGPAQEQPRTGTGSPDPARNQ